MRAKGPIRVLILLLAASLLPALAVYGHHGPIAEQVVGVATGSPWLMDCTGVSPRCIEQPGSNYPTRKAWVEPASGALTRVVTQVEGVYLDTPYPYHFADPDQVWSGALHAVGCADSKAVTAFIDKVAALQVPGSSVPAEPVGECSMTGMKLSPGTSRVYCLGAQGDCFVVQSDISSSALPTPTPTATPKPTATPTATPTAPPSATAKPTSTAGATAAGTATATASQTLAAGESATATPSVTGANTPEQTVAGIIFTPEPSTAPPAPAGGGGTDWAGSVPSANQVSTDPVQLAGSGLAALLLLLAMGFIGELFNNTFEANYDRILAGWQKSRLGRIGRAFSGLWGAGR